MRRKKPKLPVRQATQPVSTDLRKVATRETVARLLLLGWPVERIARRLHCHHRTITRAIASPEFQKRYAELEREHLSRIDRHLKALLDGAMDALEKMLKPATGGHVTVRFRKSSRSTASTSRRSTSLAASIFQGRSATSVVS